MRVTISIGALVLEIFGIIGRATLALGATILVGLEHRARVVAPAGGFQLVRALAVDIASALDRPTLALRRWLGGAKFDGDVEPVD